MGCIHENNTMHVRKHQKCRALIVQSSVLEFAKRIFDVGSQFSFA